MADHDNPSAPITTPAPGAPGAPPVPPRRSPGHRGADVKDTVAEMAAKAHEISLEAGSKMAAAMKDVINAAAGLTGFVIESARDLVQYMVRRGQMTQEEADKLIREVEAAMPKKKPAPALHAAAKTAPAKAAVAHKPAHAIAHSGGHASPASAKSASHAKATATRKAPPKKAAAKKPAPKKPVAIKPAPKKAAPKKSAPAKSKPKKTGGAKKARR